MGKLCLAGDNRGWDAQLGRSLSYPKEKNPVCTLHRASDHIQNKGPTPPRAQQGLVICISQPLGIAPLPRSLVPSSGLPGCSHARCGPCPGTLHLLFLWLGRSPGTSSSSCSSRLKVTSWKGFPLPTYAFKLVLVMMTREDSHLLGWYYLLADELIF